MLALLNFMVGQVQLGPRPEFLVNAMRSSSLKTSLEQCLEKPAAFFTPHDFSIGHRGACMMFPEHTQEAYVAAITMGAGIVECDVAVTQDGELVCRHSQCDLHTTTNILVTDLASKCTKPFSPANDSVVASAQCCTSDITLAEFKTLCGKMDASDSSATTVEGYLGGTADHRTDLYSTCGTPVSHSESIEIMKAAGRKFTPELKAYTQGDGMPSYDAIRQKVMDAYTVAEVSPSDVWLQSFVEEDVMYWINHGGNFGHQAVYLDDDYTDGTSGGKMSRFEELAASGVKILAPPMQMLVKAEGEGFVPSNYATQAKTHGFELITWTLERSGPLASGGGWYYGTSNDYTSQDGDMLDLTHTLASEVGVLSLFSDWPAAVTFYANCMVKPLSPAGSSCDPLAPACALGTSCKKSAGHNMPKRGMRNLLFATTVAGGMDGVNGCASYICM